MSDYRVYAKRSGKAHLRRGMRDKFYVTIVAANGEPLFTSEMLANGSYAVELGQRFAALLDGNFINATDAREEHMETPKPEEPQPEPQPTPEPPPEEEEAPTA